MKKRHFILFVLGSVLLIFPFASRFVNNKFNTTAYNDYTEMAANPIEMNNKLIENLDGVKIENNNDDGKDLSLYGNVVATLDIPVLDLNLPVFYGSSEENLAKGVALVEGTSLPGGGDSTHCVISGHSGYITNTNFAYLKYVEKGDIFILKTENGELYYRVVDYKLIPAAAIEELYIQDGREILSLLTCEWSDGTTKRRLVTAERTDKVDISKETSIEKEEKIVKIESEENLYKEETGRELLTVMMFWRKNNFYIVLGFIVLIFILWKLSFRNKK